MSAQDLSHEILTEIEVERILAFNQDPILVEAVKKYVLAVVYKQGVVERGKPHNPRVNWAMNLSWFATEGKVSRTDEELGQSLRAMTSAVQMIESGFKELSEMARPEKLEESNINNAE